MTELDIYRPSGAVAERDIVDGWVKVATDVSNLANFIAETDFVPQALRNKPAAVAACILTGRELGIGPMQALKSIHMVKGTPGLSAEYKRARALAAGHEIVFDETTATRCVVRGRRAGTDRWVTVTWTMDMAKRAKLATKDIWQAYPQRMLQARASGELCDILFPDASLGLATKEVLEDGGVLAIAEGAVIDDGGAPEAVEPPKADRSRTAQRKTRSKTPAPAAPAQGQPAGNEPASAGAGLPPLPGEEEDPTTSGASSSARVPDSGSRQASGAPSQSSGTTSEPAPDDAPFDPGIDYDSPGTVTDNQLKAIWSALGSGFHFDHTEKDSARKVCAHIIGRELESSKNLSRNEAKTVLDTLGHWRHQAEAQGDDPRAYLIAVMAGEEWARDAE